MLKPFLFRVMEDRDIGSVVKLWETCGLTRPWNDLEKDIAFARGKETSEILVGTFKDEVISTVMVGHDGHRGSFYYVAVAPAHQRKGIGRATIRAGENWLKEHGVWKVNLLVRQENAEVQAFYERLGYQTNQVFSMGQRLLTD